MLQNLFLNLPSQTVIEQHSYMFLLLHPWRKLAARHEREDLHQDARHHLGVVQGAARGVVVRRLLHQQLVGVLQCEQVVAAA